MSYITTIAVGRLGAAPELRHTTETLWKKLLTTVNDLERAIATIDTD
jgi:single-stranded DNA-binding protein